MVGLPRDLEPGPQRQVDGGAVPRSHGLLQARRHSLLLRPGRRLHPVRGLPPVDDGPDQSEPPLPHERTRRPQRRRQGRTHRQRHGRRHHRRQRHGGLDHLSRAAKRRWRGLAGLPGRRLPLLVTLVPVRRRLLEIPAPGAEQLRLQRPRLVQELQERSARFGPLAARHARPRRRPVAQGCARKHAAAGVLDRRALLLLRASLVGPLVRRVLRDPGARRADQQPRGLGQDRVHPQLRRGRRLL